MNVSVSSRKTVIALESASYLISSDVRFHFDVSCQFSDIQPKV